MNQARESKQPTSDAEPKSEPHQPTEGSILRGGNKMFRLLTFLLRFGSVSSRLRFGRVRDVDRVLLGFFRFGRIILPVRLVTSKPRAFVEVFRSQRFWQLSFSTIFFYRWHFRSAIFCPLRFSTTYFVTVDIFIEEFQTVEIFYHRMFPVDISQRRRFDPWNFCPVRF